MAVRAWMEVSAQLMDLMGLSIAPDVLETFINTMLHVYVST